MPSFSQSRIAAKLQEMVSKRREEVGLYKEIADDFFDIVTCHASMSYWKRPISCFDEIHRILKPGGAAALFEPQKDVDIAEPPDICTDHVDEAE